MGLLMKRHRQPPQSPKTESGKVRPVIEKTDYKAMKKTELVEIALNEGLGVPEGATKKELLELLEG